MNKNNIIKLKGKILRVSTSIPTIFSPIEYEDKLLVDGGLINNIPTNLAENLGANYIISSDKYIR